MDLYGYTEKQFDDLLDSLVTETFIMDALRNAELLPKATVNLKVTYSENFGRQTLSKQKFIGYQNKTIEPGEASVNSFKNMNIHKSYKKDSENNSLNIITLGLAS